MRPEQLSDALNYLEEDLIAEAAAVRDHSKARRPSWQKWGALAACLAVAVFAGTRLLPGEALPKPGNPPRPGASGPSQPVQGGELPTLTIQWDTSGGWDLKGTWPLTSPNWEGITPGPRRRSFPPSRFIKIPSPTMSSIGPPGQTGAG